MTGIGFAAYLDHFAGRHDPRVEGRLDSPLAGQAQRLVETGRRALAAPQPTKRAMSRALRIFRDAQRGERPSLLRLVLDSLSRPALGLRQGDREPLRFLRFQGESVVLEMQVTTSPGGLELRGQVTPSGAAKTLQVNSHEVSLAADGTFLLRRVRRGATVFLVGEFRAEVDL